MTHEQVTDRLDDFVSGELPDIERVHVQRHVDGCGECRDEVAALRALLHEVSALPPAVAPPVDLWGGIAARLEPRVASIAPAEETRVIPLAPRRRKWQPPRWALQAAAAVALVAASSLVTARLVRQPAASTGPLAMNPVAVQSPVRGPAPTTTGTVAQAVPGATAGGTAGRGTPVVNAASRTPVPGATQRGTTPAPLVTSARPVTALAAFRPAEKEYQNAIDDLVRVLDTRRGEMSPETVATLEKNLRIIDAAIAESKAALEKDPNSRELTQMLTATYDAKVRALRQAVQI